MTAYRRGERHPKAKLADADVVLIRELRALGLGYRVIARKFDCPRETIRSICRGRTRRVLSPEEQVGYMS